MSTAILGISAYCRDSAAALGAPALLSPLCRARMAIGAALGRVNTRILLGAVFFLAVTPIVLVLLLVGGLLVLTQGSVIAPFIYTLF